MARSLAAKRKMYVPNPHYFALHNVPPTNLATEQIDFLHFIKHLQHSVSKYSSNLLCQETSGSIE